TDALLLPLKALDLESGDEVITTSFTFFATAGTIHNAGGTPVFVDIEPGTFNIDPAAVEVAITPRTRAIMPVHLYGQMAAMERLRAVARARGLPIIEDAAQAIGARRMIEGQWRMAGELGWATGFSFFPSKNLGAWGDGGMMVTSDDALAERLRRLRLHGGAKQYHHDEVGTNSRLDSLQARLKSQGIGSAIYYPVPLHLQPCFSHLGYRPGRLPASERASGEVLSLPVYPELTRGQLDCVIETIRGFYR